jgi:hypothetical protein
MPLIANGAPTAALKFLAPVTAAVLLLGAASAVVTAVSPEPDLTPDFSLELMSQPLDVTNLPSGQMRPAATSRESALAIAQAFVDDSSARFRIYRATSRQFAHSEDRDVWVVVFEGGTPFFDGPDRPNASPSVVKLTGLIIDAQTGDLLRGFMEGK